MAWIAYNKRNSALHVLKIAWREPAYSRSFLRVSAVQDLLCTYQGKGSLSLTHILTGIVGSAFFSLEPKKW